MSFLDDSIQAIKKNGYKITGPRTSVLNILEEAKIALSAHDIQVRISKNTAINVVTVYRVLELFEKLEIIHRIHTKEGFVRCDFELTEGCHYFAVCKECGRADEFIQKKCEFKNFIPKNLPYKSLKHLSEVAGTCDECYLLVKI